MFSKFFFLLAVSLIVTNSALAADTGRSFSILYRLANGKTYEEKIPVFRHELGGGQFIETNSGTVEGTSIRYVWMNPEYSSTTKTLYAENLQTGSRISYTVSMDNFGSISAELLQPQKAESDIKFNNRFNGVSAIGIKCLDYQPDIGPILFKCELFYRILGIEMQQRLPLRAGVTRGEIDGTPFHFVISGMDGKSDSKSIIIATRDVPIILDTLQSNPNIPTIHFTNRFSGKAVGEINAISIPSVLLRLNENPNSSPLEDGLEDLTCMSGSNVYKCFARDELESNVVTQSFLKRFLFALALSLTVNRILPDPALVYFGDFR